jgi:hypothetical protein
VKSSLTAQSNLRLEQAIPVGLVNETDSISILEDPLGLTMNSAIAPSALLSNTVLAAAPTVISAVHISTTETLDVAFVATPEFGFHSTSSPSRVRSNFTDDAVVTLASTSASTLTLIDSPALTSTLENVSLAVQLYVAGFVAGVTAVQESCASATEDLSSPKYKYAVNFQLASLHLVPSAERVNLFKLISFFLAV